jgi:hypothetical protein
MLKHSSLYSPYSISLPSFPRLFPRAGTSGANGTLHALQMGMGFIWTKGYRLLACGFWARPASCVLAGW